MGVRGAMEEEVRYSKHMKTSTHAAGFEDEERAQGMYVASRRQEQPLFAGQQRNFKPIATRN